jgi:hypothetical protein
MPDPQEAYAEPEEQGGVKGALSRQIGPLKAWQWGIVAGVAGLIYLYVKGGSSGGGGSTTTATVPFTSNGSDGVSNVVTTTKKIGQKFLYWKATIKKKVPIVDKNGKVLGYFAAGRTILLGARIKIRGTWYYPILNMPGKYLKANSSAITYVPVYGDSTEATTTTTTPAVSNALASPTFTNLSIPQFQDLAGIDNRTIPHPVVDNGKNITPVAIRQVSWAN